MAAIVSEESGVGKSVEGNSSGQQCHSGETLAEWRSSEQVENGITSTSPPYWDTDDEHDSGPKPSELYGKYTWKIEKFSEITKRELRSNAFEVGGYKWYILIYPQGCDVCNHLSLFLCVANHDKLLPGWSHFAQFTIAVINKDPKKSKYSDTLHRFWKKEHDWGWKKFMELSKVYDGFVDTSDNLIIKAQVQVIREKSDRPFRCLDCQYRRELVRVYLTNVEQICRRFVEERRSKLGKLIEDKARWSSFFAFWREIDQTSRRRMSREKTDVILKVVVKHFFIEKEVTSTLVMDSLHSGLKALEGQTKCKKGRVKLLDAEEMPAPIIRVEKDMFVLMDDVLLLLERAAIEPLPPKEEKGPQNRTKDGNSGEDINKDSIERDERRLTELGRRTLEIFVLAHIFSNKIEVAYQEAVALKRQEELIREEEAAWQAESDQRAKRGVNMKSKKKQAKPKRNNRKGKDKGRDERTTMAAHGKNQEDTAADEKKDSNMDEPHTLSGKPDAVEDISDVSDSVDGVTEILQPDSEDRDASPVSWDTDASEAHPPAEACNNGIVGDSSMQNGMSNKRSSSVIDDSSSTCSTDSVPSVITNDPYKGASFSNYKVQKSPSRAKSQGKASREVDSWTNEMDSRRSGSVADAVDTNSESGSGKVGESESEGAAISLRDRLKWAEQHVVRKVEEIPTLQQKQDSKDQVAIERPIDNESQRKENISAVPSSPVGPVRKTSAVPPSPMSPVSSVHVRKTSSCGFQQTDKDASSPLTSTSQVTSVSKTEILKTSTARLTERSVAQVPMMSRPSTAPLVPGPSRPTAPVVSMVQTAPPLSRSVSAAGRLGPDPSPATHSYVPQSYRNVIMGNHVTSTAANLTHSSSSSSGVNPSPGYSQPSPLVSSQIFLSHGSDRRNSSAGQSSVPFGMITRDVLQNGPQWIQSSQSEASRSMQFDRPSTGLNDAQNHDLCRPVHSRSMSDLSTEFPACTSGRQNQGLLVDEFPHLDIINDLLDDEHGIARTTKASSVFQPPNSGPQFLNRQFTFPGDLGANDDVGSSSSSCRFERSRSYHHDNGFRGGYSSAGGHFDSLGDFIPQMGGMPYVNGQVDGLIPNQWRVAGSHLLYPGMRNSDNDGFSYYPDYSNMGCGSNGYTVFRPSNGH